MENEIKLLLQQVLANQVILYKRLEDIEKAVKGGARSAHITTYVDELQRKSEDALEAIRKIK